MCIQFIVFTEIVQNLWLLSVSWKWTLKWCVQEDGEKCVQNDTCEGRKRLGCDTGTCDCEADGTKSADNLRGNMKLKPFRIALS